MRQIITILLCFISALSYSQDTAYLKLHFLYGSKPLKKYKNTEKKWFGGIMDGHVGIEGDSNQIVNFIRNGKFHLVAKPRNKHNSYAVHSADTIYAILGGNPDSVKKAIVDIPVTLQQKQKFDSMRRHT